ncbi:hypothetical protein GII30_15025 [Gordonia amarae]|uniref:J domain-containing protein n=2 Tax=Gordonia amarae TaxID=36821 RepID=G7GJW1_9ACTN|nr:hypothetical protein [Gordonia amarae]MCS3879717.1 curved DNA-binding protein CbpA [Gordonia amarae]QHN18155.1 hypothetical protein GII35_15340 [Gordonia amarae]QHN40286.1 hypothetical protein GII30_15025 [Gordonia amarae]GAB03886.1 hypothetical protein GOAMR_06_00920 [Gordonia amarae NBRC 15530]
MPGIDLYAIYNLDRSRPPEVLAAQLTDALNRTDPRDTVLRNRIETARAVLGDPQRRAHYDHRLTRPQPVTEEELSRIAGRPVPTAPRTGLAAAFASTQVRLLAGVAIVLAVVLVVVVAVLASGGDDASTTQASDRGATSASPTRAVESSASPSSATSADRWNCRPVPANKVYDTLNEAVPRATFVIERTVDLPSTFSGLRRVTFSDNGDFSDRFNYEGLNQLADGSVAVSLNQPPQTVLNMYRQERAAVAVVTPDGSVADRGVVAADARPRRAAGGHSQVRAQLDIAGQPADYTSYGGRMIGAINSITDPSVVFVLLPESDKLYIGGLFDLGSTPISDAVAACHQ